MEDVVPVGEESCCLNPSMAIPLDAILRHPESTHRPCKEACKEALTSATDPVH